MAIKGAIFDFDGTIYDSLDFWKNVAKNILLEKGIIDENIDDECLTMTIEESVDYMNKKHKLNLQIKDIYNFFERKYVFLKPKNNILKIIKEYKKKNIKMIIATVTTKELVLSALKNLNLQDYFIDVVTTDDVKKSKKEPDIYLKALNILNLKKDEVYVYEDSIYAIQTLLRNDFSVIGVQGNDNLDEYKEKLIEVI